jgi:hypothetical protein
VYLGLWGALGRVLIRVVCAGRLLSGVDSVVVYLYCVMATVYVWSAFDHECPVIGCGVVARCSRRERRRCMLRPAGVMRMLCGF